ncbi:zn-finger domain-containing protein [Gigaspora margarita]|uniref:Zn-finger domain-containing protein n=1 Tax=Gigaspora margarita TaxID=4874 RepID=A0A8H3X255_GIGMA|nr:zn-finger domain-containing protein [Gigaspora margarita]
MKNLPTSLNTFLNDIFTTSIIDNESFIRFYKSATLQSADIISADPFYNNNSWFSDIAIVINTDDSYKAVTFAFAMVKWYDYCEPKEGDRELTEIYGCPRLMMLQGYDIVTLDSISHVVHMIHRFHKNPLLVNRYLF